MLYELVQWVAGVAGALGFHFYSFELFLTAMSAVLASICLAGKSIPFFKGLNKKHMLALALIVIFATILRIGTASWRVPDAQYEFEYMDYAVNIAHHHTFAQCLAGTPSSCSAFSRPYHFAAYPFFLSLAYLFTDKYVLTAQLLNLAFSIFSIIAIFILSRQLFNDQVGLMSATILAVWPTHILYSTIASGENVAVFLQLLALVALCAFLRRNSTENRVFFFSSMALYMLSRPEAIWFAPFAVVVLSFHFLKARQHLQLFLALVLTGLVSLVPIMHVATFIGTGGFARLSLENMQVYALWLFDISTVFSAIFLLGFVTLFFKNRRFLLAAAFFQAILVFPILIASLMHIKYSLYIMIPPIVIGAYGASELTSFLRRRRQEHYTFFVIAVGVLTFLLITVTLTDISRVRAAQTISPWTQDYIHVFSNLTTHFDRQHVVVADITLVHMFRFYNYYFTGYDQERIKNLISQGQKFVLFDDIYIRGRHYNISNNFTYGRSYCGSEGYNWDWCLRELKPK